MTAAAKFTHCLVDKMLKIYEKMPVDVFRFLICLVNKSNFLVI